MGGVAAKQVTTTLPTVFLSVGDPVRIGLVSSLAHPGGNMTGVTFEAAAETYGKRLQLLKEMLPGLTTVGVLRTLGDANTINAMDSLERAAPALRVILRPFDVKGPEGLDGTFATMKTSGVQAAVVIAGALTYAHGRRISELALTHHLPSCHAFRDIVAAGGLISLGPDLVVMMGQVGTYVDKIIKGAKPGDLPVQQPARYEISINLKTAKALGLTIPQSLLLRADEILQ
jgi:putative ABC transport system substrate-binding protein